MAPHSLDWVQWLWVQVTVWEGLGWCRGLGAVVLVPWYLDGLVLVCVCVLAPIGARGGTCWASARPLNIRSFGIFSRGMDHACHVTLGLGRTGFSFFGAYGGSD
ncbi:uncharacterized protein LY79DRAFT_556022 [Colletotrichum navitas]|uniref:Uncharacterized protein n=1 Tax=Colletotrichum navitas TaxID=681940 RepID=A0AAD8V434_9PEZI|nr:uncharacterized protein LY79DRAFT_556022 [Colletotrichum navitas]KAK1589891.1 hypothetical protein LY79DRAFT_556022 [Colletotrichum navitas]